MVDDISQKKDYKMIAISPILHRKIKMLAFELDIPITKLMEDMYEEYINKFKNGEK